MSEHIVLFGAGRYAEKVMHIVEKYFIVDAICDNNTAIQGGLFQNRYEIISRNELKKNYLQKRVLIALDSKSTFDTVFEQLEAEGILAEHVNLALLEESKKYGEDFYIEKENTTLIEELKSEKRKIYVLTAPSHSNMGDQAQSYCIETILKSKYQNDDIYLFDEQSIIKNFYELLFIIKQQIRETDFILLHSGYRLTNLYMVSQNIVEMMVELFKDRNLIFLPQTVHYTDSAIELRIGKKINQNVTIMCRDVHSLENAKRIFPRSQVVVYPDVVTSLIGRYQFDNKRNGILLVMRNEADGESIETSEDKAKLMGKLETIADVNQTDTTINVDWKRISQDREHYVLTEIEKYSHYQLVITNRFHGTIFALAANTPVIVLPTKDHKVVAGLKWFEEAGYKDYFLCTNLNDIFDKAKNIVEKGETSNNSDYFYQNYYKNFSLESIQI